MNEFDSLHRLNGHNPFDTLELDVTVLVELALGVVHPHHGYHEESRLHLTPSVLFP